MMEEVLGEKGVTAMLNELAEFLGLVSNSLTTTGR
jgi:hypothetical protein